MVSLILLALSALFPLVAASEESGLSASTIAGVLVMILIMLAVLYILEHYHIHAIPESVVIIVLGAVIGRIFHISFPVHIFFVGILPPIIFDSGYRMTPEFFKNIGSIAVFAFVGTFISTFVVGGGLALLSERTALLPDYITRKSAFSFGALISAVDPVATLAIFSALHADPLLYALVFGESILNDAVSIVLFQTFEEIEEVHFSLPFFGDLILSFLYITSVSVLLGLAIAVVTALSYKHLSLFESSIIETAVFYCTAYLGYLIAEAHHLSGIMTILTIGIIYGRYVRPSLSPRTVVVTSNMNQTLSFVAESVIFLYLGASFWEIEHNWHTWLVIFSLLLCFVGRAFNVVPLAAFVNLFREHKLSGKFQFLQWLSGLRGAIAFGLAMNMEVPVGFEKAKAAFLTCTFVIVFFTVGVVGTATGPILKALKFCKGPDAEHRVELANIESGNAGGTFEHVDNIDQASPQTIALDLPCLMPGEGGRASVELHREVEAAVHVDRAAFHGLAELSRPPSPTSSNSGAATPKKNETLFRKIDSHILRPLLVKGINFETHTQGSSPTSEAIVIMDDHIVDTDLTDEEAARYTTLLSRVSAQDAIPDASCRSLRVHDAHITSMDEGHHATVTDIFPECTPSHSRAGSEDNLTKNIMAGATAVSDALEPMDDLEALEEDDDTITRQTRRRRLADWIENRLTSAPQSDEARTVLASLIRARRGQSFPRSRPRTMGRLGVSALQNCDPASNVFGKDSDGFA